MGNRLTTVKQLAELINVPIERLLRQLKEAGIPELSDPEHEISESQKQALLQYLQRNHGNRESSSTTETSSRITLKRKVVSKAKVKTVSQRSKTVTIEVRKKRTYTKQKANQPQNEAETIKKRDIVDEANKEPSVQDNKNPEKSSSPKKIESETENLASPSTDKKSKKREIPTEDKQKEKRVTETSKSEEVTEKNDQKLKLKSRFNDKKRDALKHHGFEKPVDPIVRDILLPETINVAELAKRMSVKASELIKILMGLGAMVTINQVIDQDTAAIVVEEMGHKPIILKENEIENLLLQETHEGGKQEPRAPVVTIMGHVDHGKTSLLDYIRRAKVADQESGGITQHIGAYHVDTKKGSITFLDTPGHAAFTAMRARGAEITDIVVLIVAADDGVKPQTIEAIQHAKAAEVLIIVAINKIDKPNADLDRIKTELASHEIIPEDWGGDTMFVPISAKTGDGVDDLLDAISLQAELLELTAAKDGTMRGTVLEARLDKSRGPIATILIRSGTLNKGDIVLAGLQYGKTRALLDENGHTIQTVGPALPVEILGLSGVPHAGDEVIVLENERKVREIALSRQDKQRDVRLARTRQSSLEGIFRHIADGASAKQLSILLKTDVQGSVEALRTALEKLSNNDIQVKIISSGVGGITESDVNLAVASNALLIGFNVRADANAKRLAENEKVTLYYFSIIYDAIEHIKRMLSNLLEPELKEEIIGLAEVRDVFRSPKFGAVAGCIVIEGSVKRNNPIRVLRENIVIYEGTLESLRRFKEDTLEVRQGLECGIGVKNYNDVKIGDQIEVYETIEIKREL